MNFQEVLTRLNLSAREWATKLDIDQLAALLDAFYNLETHKVDELSSKISDLKRVDNIEQKVITTTTDIATPMTEQYAANIGKYGEQSFANVVKTLPCNYRVYNTAKDGHAGDFVIEYSMHGRVYRCLVDIKTYRNTVPKKEIDKFFSDLTYGNYDGGLLVSRKSHFVGHPEAICIEDITVPYATVPVMYLAKIDDDLLNSCIEVICAKMSTLVIVQMNQSTVMTSVNFINASLQHLSITRRILSEMQLTTSSQIQRCQETIISGEVQIKIGLKQMKREIDCPNIIPSHTPKFVSRNDNITDILITPTNNLSLVDEIEQTSELLEDSSFIYTKFRSVDMYLIHQILEFDWSCVSQDAMGEHTTFESPFVNMNFKPLKTKTRVEILDIDNVGMNVPNDITILLTRRGEKYFGTLSQKLIDMLQKCFHSHKK
jgi:hypothetical protein